jgi:geranylgeranyl reductase family protein
MPGPGRATYDALVVGAGPAGSHLAWLLARAGRRVALLDKARFPRHKTCGGGLSRKSLALLGDAVAPAVHRWIRGALLAFRDRDPVTKDMHPAAGCTVTRDEFDQLLARRARAAGAELFEDTALLDLRLAGDGVAAVTARGELSARRLYAADGVASTVRTRVFGRNAVAYVPALEALVPAPAQALQAYGARALFDFGALPRGYGWIFPKRDHFNVGVYSPYGGRALRRHLHEFIARQPALRGRSPVACRGYAIPLRNVAGVFERGPVALVGDAAGLAEAVFGEGIYFALRSAELAARAVLVADLARAPLAYTRLLRRELLPELRAARWLAACLFAFPSLAFERLVRNAQARELFAGLITGDTSYRGCLRAAALSCPAWLLRATRSTSADMPE